MSHHLDSPLARQDPRLDITDLYVFRGERGTVLISNTCHSIAGRDIPRGFHPEGRYEIKIDGNGDALEDLTYRLTFGERDARGVQTYEVRRLVGRDAGTGAVIARGKTDETVDLAGGGRAWVGEAGDPFWIEADVLHAVGHACQDGKKIDLAGWSPAAAKNPFAGHTVFSIVLEIPDGELNPVAGKERTLGVWSLSSLATDAGGWRPINRCGLPMVHPLFTQFNEDLGNRLNQNVPSNDVDIHGKAVAAAIAGVVRAHGTCEDPEAYGQRVMHMICPNMLPYIIGTPASFSFAGWNGRTMTDNAPEVMFSLATNTPVSIGLTKDCVTAKPRKTFPYVPVRS
jgi:hypothetical protein